MFTIALYRGKTSISSLNVPFINEYEVTGDAPHPFITW